MSIVDFVFNTHCAKIRKNTELAVLQMMMYSRVVLQFSRVYSRILNKYFVLFFNVHSLLIELAKTCNQTEINFNDNDRIIQLWELKLDKKRNRRVVTCIDIFQCIARKINWTGTDWENIKVTSLCYIYVVVCFISHVHIYSTTI